MSDLRTDLDLVGIYMAQTRNTIVHKRLKFVIDSFLRHVNYQEQTQDLAERIWSEEQ